MSKITWDDTGKRFYETGVDHGVFYPPSASGVYNKGYAWNGLVSVTETPSGAEANAIYADNIKYLSLISAEEFGATIEAYTCPDEFLDFDGTKSPTPGVIVGQQSRRSFGLSYRTRVGNDLEYQDHGYKIHLVYNATAAPSERAYSTINDSPEAVTFSWELTTTPVHVNDDLKPTALITIDSTKVAAADLAELEEMLYGTAGQDPRLPSPAEVLAIFAGALTEVIPTAPTFNSSTDTITIPSVTGVEYRIAGEIVTGSVVITEPTVVTANPAASYKFPAWADNDWSFDPA